jgi:peptidoglycan/LPS O-acetylase OafA/YrhL
VRFDELDPPRSDAAVGLIRVLLALAVVVDHSAGGVFGDAGMSGRAAVVLFYIISGFYMSLVLSTKYTGPGAWKVFYANRYLRLWPAYAVALIGTLIAYGLFVEVAGPDGPRSYLAAFMDRLSRLDAPERTFVALSNTFLFGLDVPWFFGIARDGQVSLAMFGSAPKSNGHYMILNEPAFTLSIELMFYGLAPLYVTRMRRALPVLALGLLYHLILNQTDLASLGMAYHFFPATLVYFSLGAVAYRVSVDRPQLDRPGPYLVAAAILGLFMATPLMLSSVTLLAFAAAVPFLFELTRRSRIDREIGNLSYLVYIVHWPLLLVLEARTSAAMRPLWAIGFALLLAVLLRRLVEVPVERLRARLTAERLTPAADATASTGRSS